MDVIPVDGLSPTELKLTQVLKDGTLHTIEELTLLLDPDGLAEEATLKVHVSNIRLKLEKRGYSIQHRMSLGRSCYRMVRIGRLG